VSLHPLARDAKVSVVIVTANRPEALERCVDAITTAALEPNELVIVDQSSPRVAAAVEELLSRSSVQARHLHVPLMGVSQARNLGASKAEGDLLAFTDDDCVPAPGWLSELLDAIAGHGTDGATGAVLPLPDHQSRGLVAVSSRTDPRRRVFRPGERNPPWEVGTGGNLLLSRTAFERVGEFDLRFGPGARYKAAEDVELLDRVIQIGNTIVYEPKAVVYHEMKTPAERLARRFPYGYGLGAMVVRSDNARRLPLAGAYGRIQARSLARGLVRLSAREVAEPLLALAGFSAGAYRGFVDARAGR
jgi:GT2 family glycosyltransferase